MSDKEALVSVLESPRSYASHVETNMFDHINKEELTLEEFHLLTQAETSVAKSLKILHKIFNAFREVELKKYEEILETKTGKRLKENLRDLYLGVSGIAKANMILLLNSYDLKNLKRRILAFYLEFDKSDDREMEKDELKDCIDYLARDQYIGKDKIIQGLRAFGVNIDTALTFLKEGSAANEILNYESLNQLWTKLKKRGREDSNEIVDFVKLAPLFLAFFLEYETQQLVNRRKLFRIHVGIGYNIDPKTGQEIETDENPTGLYRVFRSILKERRSLDYCVSYRDVVKALIEYRSRGNSESLTSDSLERILAKVRDIMKVDLDKRTSGIKVPLRTIIPAIAVEVCIESSWNNTQTIHDIEKYDIKIAWQAVANAEKLSKEAIHNELRSKLDLKASPNMTKKQFASILHEVLRNFIPSIHRHVISIQVAYNIARKYKESSFIISTKPTVYDISAILDESDIYEGLFNISLNRVQEFLYGVFDPEALKIRLKGKDFKYVAQSNVIKNLTKQLYLSRFIDLEAATELKDTEELERLIRRIKVNRILEPLMSELDESPTSYRLDDSFRRYDLLSTIETEYKSIKPELCDSYDESSKLIRLQAEANLIDRIVEERKKSTKKLRVRKHDSIAFPNNQDIDPILLLPILEQSGMSQQEINQLKSDIQSSGKISTYQELYKYALSNRASDIEPRSSSRDSRRYNKKKERSESRRSSSVHNPSFNAFREDLKPFQEDKISSRKQPKSPKTSEVKFLPTSELLKPDRSEHKLDRTCNFCLVC
jgi:hypothetical protein